MIPLLAESTMTVPVSWVLASGGSLATCISILAGIIYASQSKRITALELQLKSFQSINETQSKTIADQNKIILNLQSDIQNIKASAAELRARLSRYEKDCGTS